MLKGFFSGYLPGAFPLEDQNSRNLQFYVIFAVFQDIFEVVDYF
jgi:hypothetical protein